MANRNFNTKTLVTTNNAGTIHCAKEIASNVEHRLRILAKDADFRFVRGEDVGDMAFFIYAGVSDDLHAFDLVIPALKKLGSTKTVTSYVKASYATQAKEFFELMSITEPGELEIYDDKLNPSVTFVITAAPHIVDHFIKVITAKGWVA